MCAGFANDVVYGDNADFSIAASPKGQLANGLITDGELWIGRTAVNAGGTHISVGTLTSPDGSLTFGYSAPNITAIVTGGSTVGQTITGDDAVVLSPTLGNWNIFGQKAGTVPVMITHGAVSTLSIEDRTWETQYVVDTSTALGLRGTFATIQTAINQAMADGMAFNNPKKIYIRTGTYTEDLTIQPGTILVGEVMSYPTGGVITPQVTTINGTHTFTGNAVVGFNNLTFFNSTPAANTFSGGDIVLAYFDNCYLASSSTGNHIDITAANSTIKFSRTSFANNGDQVCFTLPDTGSALYLFNCQFQQAAAFNCAGNLILEDSNGLGEVQMTASSTVTAKNCFWFGNGPAFLISGTGSGGSLRNCSFMGAGTAAIESTTGTWYLQACAAGDQSNNLSLLYENGTNYQIGQHIQGNLVRSRLTAVSTNLTPDDYYIGVTSTAAARTINLPDGTSGDANQDQIFLIKDQSGGAATNNITVTTVSGVKTIDGATSQIINMNYGFIGVKYDGTNYFSFGINSATFLQTLSDDVNTIVSPIGDNIQLVGHINEQGATKFSTVTAGTNLLNINPMSTARWIVDPLGFNGTHTTITASMASATSGDTIFLMPGTYTENFTIKPGINLTAYMGDSMVPTVTIVGNITMTGAGTACVSNIRLQTNAANLITVSGANACILKVFGCFINCTNNTGVSFSNSNAASQILINNSYGNLATTGIALFASSSAGNLNIQYSNFSNTGASTTANTISAGTMNFFYSSIMNPVTTSGTSAIGLELSAFFTNAQNVIALTVGGSGSNTSLFGSYASGTAPSISISSSFTINTASIDSSNTNAITGAGTINHSFLDFVGSSRNINTTTQNGGISKGSSSQAPSLGFLGEQIRATAAGATPANNTPTTIATLALTAGVWDVTAVANYAFTGAATIALLNISTTNNTITGTSGDSFISFQAVALGTNYGLSVPAFRVVVTTSTNYFMVVQVNFTTGTATVGGRISAVRVA